MHKTFAHIDADAFFLSVELINRPHLRGKPVLVVSRADRRGIALCASYEARTFGIRAGTPLFQAKKLCPGAILIPAHGGLYEEASHRLMNLLRGFSPALSVASLDEAFLDLSGLDRLYGTDFRGIGMLIQHKTARTLGITVSVGIAQTKTLAKIASDFEKPAGLTAIDEKERAPFLQKIPVGKIPGVGKQTEKVLQTYGIQTALKLAEDPRIAKLLGKRGEDLRNELNGHPVWPIETAERLPRSISETRTFPDFWRDKEAIFTFSLKLLLSLSRRMRSFSLSCGGLEFFLTMKDFQTAQSKEKFLHGQTRDDIFIKALKRHFTKIFEPGRLYRKSGIVFSHLKPAGPEQLDLFENRKDPSGTIDRLFARYGSGGITRGIFLRSSSFLKE